MSNVFADFDFKNFWDVEYYQRYSFNREKFVGKPINQQMIDEAEKALGYKLPKSYIELLQSQNGGAVVKTKFPTQQATSYADDYINIYSIFSIDRDCKDSIFQTEQLIEWGFPTGFIYFGDVCTDHDWIAFDYRNMENSEPQIVHVYVDGDEPEINFLAKDFETFIKGLEFQDEFDDE